MLILFALGWTANSAQEAFDPLLIAPKTARWTCKRNAEANARRLHFTCVNTAGNAYTVEAEAALPLHSSFLGTLWPFRSASWRRFKHSQGVHGTIRATLPTTQLAESTLEQNLPNHVLWTFLNRHFTGAVPGLLFALSSGNKSQLDPALKIRLSHAGLAHLMAVSGYHVGLVSFPVLLFLRHRRSAFRFIGFVGLVGTWSFIGFCGFPTSAVRAGLMITGYSLSQLARLNLSAMQLLSLAAWSMLIYCHAWSRDLGMQLSFVEVFAILLGIELLNVSRIRNPIALYLAVPVAAQLGTGFITWPTFGVFPKFFLFFNLLASPLMALLGTALAGIAGADLVLGWRAAGERLCTWAVGSSMAH
jgi:ComEC/Rec2-related protein